MITAKQLYHKGIEASDGHIGSVRDVYFDDQIWSIRYLVVDTGKWLPGRKVLLAPEVIVLPWHVEASVVSVRLTRDQVRSSPDIDTTQPVSRKTEHLLHSHFGWIPYWEVPGVPAPPPPLATTSGEEQPEPIRQPEPTADPHLRSAREVNGYRVHARDGETGHIEDVLFDDEFRRVLFLSVDLEEWLLAKKVLISPRVVATINRVNSEVEADLPCRIIKASQEYKPAA